MKAGRPGRGTFRAGRRASLVQLVTLVLRGPVTIAARDGDALVLQPQQEDPVLLPAAIMTEACERGLVQERDGALAALAPARGFLRRALPGEAETAFADQHRLIDTVKTTVEGVQVRVRRNAACDFLLRLTRFRDRSGGAFFPREALAAGERLAVDFERGHLQPQVTMIFEPRLSSRAKGAQSATASIPEAAAAARARVNAAVSAIGPELSGVALDVCCFAKGLETVEWERQWPARSAKLLLRAALMALARHYAPPRKPRPRHWGDADRHPSCTIPLKN